MTKQCKFRCKFWFVFFCRLINEHRLGELCSFVAHAYQPRGQLRWAIPAHRYKALLSSVFTAKLNVVFLHFFFFFFSHNAVKLRPGQATPKKNFKIALPCLHCIGILFVTPVVKENLGRGKLRR